MYVYTHILNSRQQKSNPHIENFEFPPYLPNPTPQTTKKHIWSKHGFDQI